MIRKCIRIERTSTNQRLHDTIHHPRMSYLFTVGWLSATPCHHYGVRSKDQPSSRCVNDPRWLRTVMMKGPTQGGRSYRGERTDQQRFYNQFNNAFVVLGYVHLGVRIAEAERHVSLKETTLLFSPPRIITWCHRFRRGPARSLNPEHS